MTAQFFLLLGLPVDKLPNKIDCNFRNRKSFKLQVRRPFTGEMDPEAHRNPRVPNKPTRYIE